MQAAPAAFQEEVGWSKEKLITKGNPKVMLPVRCLDQCWDH